MKVGKDKKEERDVLNAASPDELALVKGAKEVGFEFLGIQRNVITIRDYYQNELQFKLLNTLEFNSTRKRSSVIVETIKGENEGEIKLITKGADSIIEPLLNKENESDKNFVYKLIDEFSKIGLRTLTFSEKKLTQEEYDQFNVEFKKAENVVEDRE